MRWLDGITDSMVMSDQTLGDTGGQRNLDVTVHGVTTIWTQLSN